MDWQSSNIFKNIIIELKNKILISYINNYYYNGKLILNILELMTNIFLKYRRLQYYNHRKKIEYNE